MLRLVSFIIAISFIQITSAQSSIPDESQQMLLVVSDSWQSSKGKLFYLERSSSDDNWKSVSDIFSESIEVQLGKNGLAWGQGLHYNSASETNIKKEGDGKSPAGIFELTYIFGYQYPDFELKMPFLFANSDLLCIDDVKSNYYNQVIDTTSIFKKDWTSYEDMLRQDNLYEWGIVVAHNSPVIGENNGSCIFLHIEKGKGSPTVGCTSMSKEDLLKIIQNLDEDKSPTLVQVPKEFFEQLQKQIAGLELINILE